MKDKKSIGIGLLGLGVVGSGVANSLIGKKDSLASLSGCSLNIKRILVRSLRKKRAANIPRKLLTLNPDELLQDPDIDIIIELIGGEKDALNYIQQAIKKGKHVVTANKEIIAKHGPELLSLAAKYDVDLRYEASAGGGIPIINPLKRDLLGNDILAIHAIINGTTNYIVTKMSAEDMDFEVALKEAQKLGYAEADPANDVDGIDAVYKLAILASLAFHTEIRPKDIFCEGITKLTSRDFRYAAELGYAIKLLAIARNENNGVQARVHPVFIDDGLLLAKVDGVFNAVQVEGDLTGRVIFYGQGAGSLPTTSAVIADIIQLAQNIRLGLPPKHNPRLSRIRRIMPFSDIRMRYYLRMTIADQPGVLARIARILGEHSIGIASVIQKEADEDAQTAEIVIMTHIAQESAIQLALNEIGKMDIVQEIGNLIRVEDQGFK